MHLSLGGLNRRKAASSAGVSERTFRRWMHDHRVAAPRADAKLNPTIVQHIRDRAASHTSTHVELAAEAGVSRDAIDRIVRYDRWRRT